MLPIWSPYTENKYPVQRVYINIKKGTTWAANNMVKISKDVVTKMRLTMEQRLAALERENVVLQDRVTILHKLLKEQRELINDYITQSVSSANETKGQNGNLRPEDALFTFICKRKFDMLEKHIERIRKSVTNSTAGLKVG